MLLTIQGISYICFTLVVILIIQLFIRLHVKESVNINILGNKLNNYLNKLIVFNKKVNVIYIWLILLIILLGLAASRYFSYELYNDLEKYISTHNFSKKIDALVFINILNLMFLNKVYLELYKINYLVLC